MSKIRVDFSAHYSVVVEVFDGDEDAAVERAEAYMKSSAVVADWEIDDGGIEDVDDSEEAINY